MSNIIVKIPSALKVQVAYSFPGKIPENSYAYPILSQTTSYRDGDEGWQLANVWNSIYGNNTTPRRAIIGLSDFYTLESNNQFGNRFRFTLPDGQEGTSAFWIDTNFGIIYDNYLGLELRNFQSSNLPGGWNQFIDDARSLFDGTYYPPTKIIMELLRDDSYTTLQNGLNNVISANYDNLWMATTNAYVTNQSYRTVFGAITSILKNNTGQGIGFVYKPLI